MCLLPIYGIAPHLSSIDKDASGEDVATTAAAARGGVARETATTMMTMKSKITVMKTAIRSVLDLHQETVTTIDK